MSLAMAVRIELTVISLNCHGIWKTLHFENISHGSVSFRDRFSDMLEVMRMLPAVISFLILVFESRSDWIQTSKLGLRKN